MNYPATRRDATVETLHGVTVADPYRWLEDLDSRETRDWVAAQNAVTFHFLETIPGRAYILKRLQQLWNHPRRSIPYHKGNRYFVWHNDGLQNQSVLYVQEGLTGAMKVLLDPNTLSPDGTVALSGQMASADGKLLAYAISDAGSDWQTWKIRDIDAGRDLPDTLKWCKFTAVAWLPDSAGFYYGRYDEPQTGNTMENANYFQKLCFHKLGAPQSADPIVYERPEHKEWGFGPTVTDDGKFLLIDIWQGAERNNLVYYRALDRPAAPILPLLDANDAQYSFLGNAGDAFYFQTTKTADCGRVICIDRRDPEPAHWREIIPMAKDALQSVKIVAGVIYAEYLRDACSRVRRFRLDGAPLADLPLPGIGSVSGMVGEWNDREIFYSFQSFTVPTTIYHVALPDGAPEVYYQTHLDFAPETYETKQVFVTSKDGARVPMFLMYRKGLALDGKNPTQLSGYGGFNISLTPSFNASSLVWLESGGVLAVANLRGGGEYGEAWHEAGMRANKQNVFDDFVACAEWLIANRYTCSAKLAISGRSNGGLLVGACLTQRPELFGAALPGVGVMDMLRFHKFTIGWAWISDYGNPERAADFKTLYAYYPLHNLKPGAHYPPTLITTGDHDDRVVPCHSFKFAAAMQAAQAGTAPVLIRIETRAGHGAGKPIAKSIEETADCWAFLTWVFGMNVPTE